jgi:hypothetical protein
MSSSRTCTDFTCVVLLTHLSIHFVLVGTPLFLHIFICVYSDVLSLVRIVPKLVSAHQGQKRRPKDVGVKMERLMKVM